MNGFISTYEHKKFIGTTECKKTFSVGRSFLDRMRKENLLLEGVHFIRFPGSSKLLWNTELLRDFFATSGGPAHQRAIDAYLQSLPSNQPKKVGRKKADQ